jgi:tripartite-type tricarboxylate transporter receptor subunit TctC
LPRRRWDGYIPGERIAATKIAGRKRMRRLIAATVCALALSAASTPPHAQTYPTQPIRIVVSFPAGGATDMITRAVAQVLSENLKQSIFIENRPGGAGIAGMMSVVRATPDGHTLGVGTLSNLALNPALAKTPYDARKDFAPIALMTEVHIVMATPASLPVNNLEELIAWAKKNPDKMNFSSNGPGSSGHIVGELLKRKYGFEAAHVPYGGDAPILNALMGGHIQLGILAAPPAAEFVKTGRIKAIAVTSATRSPALPGVPTLGELGSPEIVAGTWFSIVAPAATPQPIQELLNREIDRAMTAPETRRVFANAGVEPASLSLQEFRDYVRREQDKWAETVKTLGIKIEQ